LGFTNGHSTNVKYDRSAMVLVNAVKEQQQQIKQQAEQSQNQQRECELFFLPSLR
jgi:hypothetical protein